MARDKSDDQEEELTPEKRLDALEKNQKLNKIFMLVTSVLLVCLISIQLTLIILGGDDTPAEIVVEAEDNTEQTIDVAKMAQQIKALDNKFRAQSAFIQSTSNETLQQTLIDQEKSYRKFLGSVDSAISELANMVPGSRAWLEQYSDELSSIAQRSKQREKKLKSVRVTLEEAESQEMEF